MFDHTSGSLLARRRPSASRRAFAARRARRAAAVALAVAAMALGAPSAWAAEATPLIDLNRATAEQLETLPGIGAAKAAAIVEHREAQGDFASVDELEEVRGIGPALLTKIRPRVEIGTASSSASKSSASPSAPSKSAASPTARPSSK